MLNLAHRASLHSGEKIAPSKPGIKHLELAATVDWLWQVEKYDDWRGEIGRRKGKKVQAGRLDKAVDLLKSLGLSPPQNVPDPALI